MRSGAPAGSEVVAPRRRVNGYVAQDGLIEHRACDLIVPLSDTPHALSHRCDSMRHMRHRVERACRIRGRNRTVSSRSGNARLGPERPPAVFPARAKRGLRFKVANPRT
jgi:hypothetical protein